MYKEVDLKNKIAIAEKKAASEITPLDLVIDGKKVYFSQSDLYEIFKESPQKKIVLDNSIKYGPSMPKGDALDDLIIKNPKTEKQKQFNLLIKTIKTSDKDTFGIRKTIGKNLSVYNKYQSTEIKSIHDKAHKIINQELAKVTGKLAQQIKAAPMDKNGKITPTVAGALSAMITSRQLGKYGAPGTDDDTASEFLNDDNIKNTKVFVKQQGSDYEIWIKNEKDPENIQKYKVDANKVASLFGPSYVNDTSNESMRKLIGKGNTNLTKDPNLSLMKKSFGDFPRVRKLNITADLPEDLSNSDEHIISINLKKKDGRWQNFMLSDTNNLGRVGFEQGKKLLNNLSDSEIIKYIKVEYPNYDFSQLQGY